MEPVQYVYPGTGSAADSHAYPTRLEHGMQEPLTLVNPLDATQGPGVYSDNMWSNLQTLRDVGLQMALLERFRLMSVYRPFVPTTVAMRTPTGAIAEEMTVKGVFAMEPNIDPVGRKQIWFTGNYTDTFSKKITFEDHADKVVLHEYDDRVQAYLFRGQIGMINIARTLLGESVSVALDILARNAYLSGPRCHWIAGGDVESGMTPDFSGITETDVFDIDLGREIWEALAYADVPMASNPNGVSGTLFCVTTPSTPNVIKSASTGNSQWREANLYANPSLLLRHEVGMYDNTRFLQTRRNVLWNCGEHDLPGKGQFVTQMDYGPGDGGSPDLVDGIYRVGQDHDGIEHFIELDGVTGLAVNDVVTLHTRRTNDYGVTNGVDFKDGTISNRRIVKIQGNSVAFDKPLTREYPAGSFLTKGTHVHCSLYIGGPGVVNGVADPIMAYPMPPIDDARAIWRFIWKGRFKFQPYEPEMWHVVFHGGKAPTFGIGVAP